MISSRIILDSVNPAGIRLTTWLLTYPRFIHSEFMTHRAFSRNAASSRAIPIEKMIEAVRSNPAMPARWGKKGKGMQDGGVLDEYDVAHVKDVVEALCNESLIYVEQLDKLGASKQIANRYIEPFMHMTVLMTSSEYGMRNFFKLRAHPAAEPTFQALAYPMLEQYLGANDPRELDWGMWHLPGYDKSQPRRESDINDALKYCTVKAARTSYTKFDDDLTMIDAIRIHDETLSKFGHWSPFEHCAQAVSPRNQLGMFPTYPWSNFDMIGLHGIQPSCWGQYRKLFNNENGQTCDLNEILATKPEWIQSQPH